MGERNCSLEQPGGSQWAGLGWPALCKPQCWSNHLGSSRRAFPLLPVERASMEVSIPWALTSWCYLSWGAKPRCCCCLMPGEEGAPLCSMTKTLWCLGWGFLWGSHPQGFTEWLSWLCLVMDVAFATWALLSLTWQLQSIQWGLFSFLEFTWMMALKKYWEVVPFWLYVCTLFSHKGKSLRFGGILRLRVFFLLHCRRGLFWQKIVFERPWQGRLSRG